MENKTKTVLMIILSIFLLLIVAGGSFFLGRYLSVSYNSNFLNVSDTENTAIVDESLATTDDEESCPESGDCPVVSCDGETELEQIYVEDTFFVYDVNNLRFKYKYPYGWHVREYAIDTGGSNYLAKFEMDKEPFTPLTGDDTYTVSGTEITSISPAYAEQWYIDTGAEKLPYTLKVAGAYCYKTTIVQYTGGKMYSCVYNLGNPERKLFISTMDLSITDEFQVIAESIEKI